MKDASALANAEASLKQRSLIMQKKNWIFITIIICLISQIIYGQEYQFMYGDSMRSYVVYEPELEQNENGWPLVIGLHGTSADGVIFIGVTNLVLKANKAKFIAACPNGLNYGRYTYFNAGGFYEELTHGTDDLGFISAVIDTMIKNYNIDTTRIYVMGYSNGSMMAYRAADELSHKIAAIGAVSGQMAYDDCNPEFPVPIIHFHGLNDSSCLYEGGPNPQNFDILPAVDTVMTIWREINNCGSIPDTILNNGRILGRKWASLDGKSDVILYTIENWGHKWPRTFDPGIDATEVIWDFLKKQNKSSVTNIEKDDIQFIPKDFKLYQNYPNPFNPSTTIKYSLNKSGIVMLKVNNLVGQEIETLVNEFQRAGEYEITWQANGLPSGLYFYTIQTKEFSQTCKLILQK